jgi:uncharacterized protein
MNPQDQDKSRPKGAQLLAGLIFGIVFGFLLQKGGVGKYHILLGQLLLLDWTVVKVMGSAIIVGMVGVFLMHAFGLVKLHVKRTKFGANIVGGLIFGAGFGLSAYCPGTNMTALGQGNFDAIFVALGMIVGSYLFAEFSGVLNRTVEKWGERGELLLPQIMRMPRGLFVALFSIVLTVCLVLVEKLAVR